MTGENPRHTVAWQQVRKRFVDAARARGDLCGICGMAIDYTLSGRARWGPTVDHQYSVATHPHLAFEPSLLRMSHRACNASNGGKLGRARQLARRNGGATRRVEGMTIREW